MKKLDDLHKRFLLTGRYFTRLTNNIFHPLKGIPVPDFNNQYDSTIL
ncbi:MAG TPA: hypothetical protein VIZ28_05965 [Chitinophagaceae bacterium]